MKKYTTLEWLTFALLAIGGLNWGLYGLFGFDLVAAIFGEFSLLSRIIYSIVGLSALYLIIAPMFAKDKEKVHHAQVKSHI